MQAPVRIADLVRGEYGWTPRQRQVLDLLTSRYTNSQIAEALGISLDGAKWHVSEVITKLGVDSREEAAEYWREYNGLGRRFVRVFRGVATVGGLKWLVGGAGAMAGTAAVAGAAYLAVVAAYGRGEDEAAAPVAPVATVPPGAPAAPAGELPGEDGFRQFAASFDSELAEGGLDALASRLRATTYTCGTDGRVEFSDMTCTPGTQVSAVRGGRWRSEGSMSTVDEMAGQLRALGATLQPALTDTFGDGALRVHAVAVSPGRTVAVVTGIAERPLVAGGPGPSRFALAVDFVHDGTSWTATRVLTAHVLAEDFLAPSDEGRTALGGWEPL
jgi:DNA-binding CsgD family transcriptional regulator